MWKLKNYDNYSCINLKFKYTMLIIEAFKQFRT